MGRRLQIDWSNVDFDDFSLTFIDIVAPTRRSTGYKECDDRALFGDLGGAGIGSATSNNMAWLRVGLFGGGFGLDLDNRGYAGAFLISLEIPRDDAGVQFKLDASYRVDCCRRAQRRVGDEIVDGATDVMAGFEAAKAARRQYVYRFVEIGHHVLDVIDDFLDSMPDEIIEKITGVFPMLAGNTDVIWDLRPALQRDGARRRLRESGIIELLDKLVLAVDKVEAVAFNNTFVQGVEAVRSRRRTSSSAARSASSARSSTTAPSPTSSTTSATASRRSPASSTSADRRAQGDRHDLHRLSTAWQVFESFGNDPTSPAGAPPPRSPRATSRRRSALTCAFVGAEDAPTCHARSRSSRVATSTRRWRCSRRRRRPTPPPPPCFPRGDRERDGDGDGAHGGVRRQDRRRQQGAPEDLRLLRHQRRVVAAARAARAAGAAAVRAGR